MQLKIRMFRVLTKVSRRFCQQRKDEARKLKEKLREEERKIIEDGIHKKRPGFSTLNSTVKAGKFRLLRLALLGGVFIGALKVSNYFRFEYNPAYNKRGVVLTQEVGSQLSQQKKLISDNFLSLVQIELSDKWIGTDTNPNLGVIETAFKEEVGLKLRQVDQLIGKLSVNPVSHVTEVKTLNTDEAIFLMLSNGTIIISRVAMV